MPEHNSNDTENGPTPITALVPMIPVRDVQRSLEFFTLLGFALGNRVPPDGRVNWAWLYSPQAPDWRRGPNLMLSRSENEIDTSGTDILFYLYAADLPGLRAKLVAAGKNPGPIQYPDYLPEGEFSIQDPDGYCLMIAQSTSDTP